MSQPSQLNINESIVAFSDVGVTNNPLMKHWDWSRNLNGLTVYQPKAEQHLVAPRSSLEIFDTLRSTSFDGTTQIALTYLTDNTYRFTYTGTGTDPIFAINSPVTFVSGSLVFATQPNQTMMISGPTWACVAGSYLYIKNTTELPACTISPINAGLWVVLGYSGATNLIVARPEGTTFSGTDETVTSDSAPFVNYVLSEVQVGDKLRVSAPFAVGNQQTFVVSAVTSKWVDVVSTTPLLPETLLPGADGMTFYSAAKRFTRIECDQRARVYFNGAIGNSDEIEPWSAGDRKFMGWNEKVGPVWSLDIFNLSNVPMVVNVFTAE